LDIPMLKMDRSAEKGEGERERQVRNVANL
jgi:hypothetical protein